MTVINDPYPGYWEDAKRQLEMAPAAPFPVEGDNFRTISKLTLEDLQAARRWLYDEPKTADEFINSAIIRLTT